MLYHDNNYDLNFVSARAKYYLHWDNEIIELISKSFFQIINFPY